ncbi:serine hydrolase domain-containing protein [Actinomadura hibisca]|uniref:serine hydrolase domain-containing protein n=1 Tax=Actinomadura hibisca TaxID=68565 RepID=UPI00082971AF|nr:serine hydrolase domain-containing protein [Actinomadura hibisca]
MGAGRFRRLATAAALLASLALAPSAASAQNPEAGPEPAPAFEAVPQRVPVLDAARLRATLNATRAAGMYGLYSTARVGDQEWDGASGVADPRTRRPVTPGMLHRVGAVTATFTATALMQQVERGRLRLDDPIAAHLPNVIYGERGRQITVRMLLNHTSGVADHLTTAFPSLAERSPRSLDEGRLRRQPVRTLVSEAVNSPLVTPPDSGPSYSGTNDLIAGLLLEKVSGERAEDYITRNVIRRAGLRATAFPTGPEIKGPHSGMYESLHRRARPPRDYSTFDMSYAWTAGALVSTTDDVTRFYRALFTGGLVTPASLAEMRRTVPAPGGRGVRYGLGLVSMDLPCGTFWGHDGAVFGAGTRALTSADGTRQIAVGWNLTKYQRLDAAGRPIAHPIDNALRAHVEQGLCGGAETPAADAPAQPLPLEYLTPDS